MKNIEDILEIGKIREQTAQFCKTLLGKEKVYEIKPSNDIKFIRKELDELDELISLTDKFNDIPLNSELNMYEEIQIAKKGDVFDEIKLNQIKQEIQNTVDVIKFSMWIDYDLKYLNNYFLKLKANEYLFNRISQTLTPENEIKDSASKLLSELRHQILAMDKNIHATLIKTLSKYKEKLAGDNFVLRNGHFSIPVNSSHKASVDGLVQDVSDSGQTTFIEPKEVIALENEMTILKIKERDEISRILKELTDEVVKDSDQLILNNSVLADLDFIQAKAKYAREIEAHVPQINNKYYFKLFSARHPLIDKHICVPNDYFLGNDKKLMLISGPNAGGKTISLKTIAICAYLIKLGFAIPASKDSDVCVFENIYIDIGDMQSIESNLSTFSAHISSLSVVFQYISSTDLVLIDEICTGTDPKEGEAMSVAIVKFLLKKGCLSVITSHYELLKKYGLTNPNILNASFLFNEKNISPTFKILLGASGKSYGFLIGQKFGLDSSIIADARKIYENSFASEDDKKLHALNEKERYLIQKEQKLKERQEVLNKEKEGLSKKESDLKAKEIALKNQKIDKFDVFLNDKYNEINNIYNAFMKDKDLKKAEEKLDRINVAKKKNENIEVGNYVEIKSLGFEGKIAKIQGNKIEIHTTDGFIVNTTKDKCELKDEPKAKLKSSINIDKFIGDKKIVSSSLNLVGYHIDEGIATLDKYLDDCVIAGLKEVKIIHGYGSGKLKMAIHDFLKKKKIVKSFKLGNELDGGSGATLVTLE